MVLSKKAAAATKKRKAANNSVDVKGAADMPRLSDLLKKNKVVVVLIWANYCGHCHTYKDDVWSNLLANKKRKAGLASIHYDQLENAPELIPKKVSGYPTVIRVGPNGAEEIEDARDLGKMNSIVESGEAGEPESQIDESITPELTEDAETARNESLNANPNTVLNSISMNDTTKPKSASIAPNPMNDMLNSQEKNGALTVERKMDSGEATKGGGALYKALLGMFKHRQTRTAKPKRSKQTRRQSR